MTTPETLRVMPREMRLMSERILSLTALPKGFALMITDVVMYSESMGLGGFALLEQRLDSLKEANMTRLSLSDDGGRLDAGGQHAWCVVPSVIDLLQLEGVERIEVANVTDPGELKIAEGLGARAGLAITVKGMLISASRRDPGDPVLDRLMQDGCTVPAPQWWRIYELAQTALLPDSAVSRRHAGPVIVTEDGRVIGRKDNDDDTDVSFIGSDGKETQETNA